MGVERLWNFLGEVDFVVLFSLWRESFGFFFGENVGIILVCFRDIFFRQSLFGFFGLDRPLRCLCKAIYLGDRFGGSGLEFFG